MKKDAAQELFDFIIGNKLEAAKHFSKLIDELNQKQQEFHIKYPHDNIVTDILVMSQKIINQCIDMVFKNEKDNHMF